MSQSYCSNRVHVVFSTKERGKIISAELQPKLWAYMAGIAKKQGFDAITIGGIEDHVHLLLGLAAGYAFGKGNPVCEGKFVEVDE